MKLGIAPKLVLCLLLCSHHFALGQTVVGQITGLPAFYVSGIAVNPVTNRLYVSSSNPAEVVLLNGATRTVESTMFTGDQWAQSVAVNPLNDHVYVGVQHDPTTGDSSVLVLNGATNQIVQTIFVSSFGSNGGDGLVALAVNPVTNRVYVADANLARIAVINGASNHVVGEIGLSAQPVAVAVNYATDKIYAVYNNPNGELIEIDGASNKVVHKMAIAQPASAIAVDATLNRIYVLGASYSAGTGEPYAYSVLNGNIYVVNGKTNELVQTIPDLNYSIAVDVLTGRLWAANLLPIGGSGTVAQINLASDKTVSSVSLEATQFGQIAVDPVRNVAYSLGQYGRITVLSGR